MSLISKFKIFWEKFKSLFDNINDELVEKAIEIVNKFKTAIENGTYDSWSNLVCSIIPTNYDDLASNIFKNWFTNNADKIINWLKVYGVVISYESIDDVVNEILEAISALVGDDKKNFLNTLATEVYAAYEDDGKISKIEIAYIIELAYKAKQEEDE